MRISLTTLLALLSLIAVSCVTNYDFTTAKSITIRPGKGGVLTLSPQDDPRARAKAQAIMKQTCREKTPEIVEEGETVVGSRTTAKTTKDNNASNGKTILVRKGKKIVRQPVVNDETTETAESRDVTEWRVTYECK